MRKGPSAEAHRRQELLLKVAHELFDLFMKGKLELKEDEDLYLDRSQADIHGMAERLRKTRDRVRQAARLSLGRNGRALPAGGQVTRLRKHLAGLLDEAEFLGAGLTGEAGGVSAADVDPVEADLRSGAAEAGLRSGAAEAGLRSASRSLVAG